MQLFNTGMEHGTYIVSFHADPQSNRINQLWQRSRTGQTGNVAHGITAAPAQLSAPIRVLHHTGGFVLGHSNMSWMPKFLSETE